MKKIYLQIFLAAFGLLFGSYAFGSNPYTKANNSWISLSGEVESVKPNSFQLKFGKKTVTVEMDDGDRDADAYQLLKGDKVTVVGKIDRDLFEKTKIEAGSVFVENLGTTFFASSLDDEDDGYYYQSPITPIVLNTASLYGKVSSVNDREFTIDTGLRKVTVETKGMPYNPMDGEGYLKISKGDLVRVYGTMTHKFFEGRELEASIITKYFPHKESDKEAR